MCNIFSIKYSFHCFLLSFILFSFNTFAQKKTSSLKNKKNNTAPTSPLTTPKNLDIQKNNLFSLIEKLEYDSAYFIIKKFPQLISSRNKEGYTPIHWLILHFESTPDNEVAISKNKEGLNCFINFLNNVVDAAQLTKEGWNLLQLAVAKAKPEIADMLLTDFRMDSKVKDSLDNNLYHLLGYAINNAKKTELNLLLKVLEKFIIGNWERNKYGHTPLIFILSEPRCINNCPDGALNIINSLCDEVSVKLYDNSNKNAYYYASQFNKWALPIIEKKLNNKTSINKQNENKNKGINEHNNIGINENFEITFSGLCDNDNWNERYMRMTHLSIIPVKFTAYRISFKLREYELECRVENSKKNKYGIYEYRCNNRGLIEQIRYNAKVKVMEIEFRNASIFGSKLVNLCKSN